MEDTETTDITLLVGSEKTPVAAHRAILAARSPIFKAMFFGNMAESDSNCKQMHLPEVAPKAFIEFKKYLYSGCASITGDIVIELLR